MKKLTTGLIASLLLATSLPAVAERFDDRHGNGRPIRVDRHERQYERPYGRHVDRHRHYNDTAVWGVLGAGLALGALALTIDAPRSPPVVIASPPPPQRLWYYCESYRTYYPNVNYCPEGWRAVPAY